MLAYNIVQTLDSFHLRVYSSRVNEVFGKYVAIGRLDECQGWWQWDEYLKRVACDSGITVTGGESEACFQTPVGMFKSLKKRKMSKQR
jgi:hypothetical protein